MATTLSLPPSWKSLISDTNACWPCSPRGGAQPAARSCPSSPSPWRRANLHTHKKMALSVCFHMPRAAVYTWVSTKPPHFPSQQWGLCLCIISFSDITGQTQFFKTKYCRVKNISCRNLSSSVHASRGHLDGISPNTKSQKPVDMSQISNYRILPCIMHTLYPRFLREK